MPRTIFVVATFLLLTAARAQAQPPASGVDYQLRLLLHGQASMVRGNGLAGWWVLPDVTVDNNNWRSLVVGGWLNRQQQRWIEMMGGAMIDQNGRVEPLLNLRWNERSLPRLSLTADLELFPTADRFYWWIGGDTPLPNIIPGVRLRAGLESENIAFANRGDSLGVGPRLVVAIPRLAPVSVVTAYQRRNDRDFVRSYVLFNF